MAAPKGNKNALGNRGGGRKSAYQELADANYWLNLFTGEFDRKKLERKIKSGKYSVADAMILKGLLGDTRIISMMYRKLVPGARTWKAYGAAAKRAKMYELEETMRKLFELARQHSIQLNNESTRLLNPGKSIQG